MKSIDIENAVFWNRQINPLNPSLRWIFYLLIFLSLISLSLFSAGIMLQEIYTDFISHCETKQVFNLCLLNQMTIANDYRWIVWAQSLNFWSTYSNTLPYNHIENLYLCSIWLHFMYLFIYVWKSNLIARFIWEALKSGMLLFELEKKRRKDNA